MPGKRESQKINHCEKSIFRKTDSVESGSWPPELWGSIQAGHSLRWQGKVRAIRPAYALWRVHRQHNFLLRRRTAILMVHSLADHKLSWTIPNRWLVHITQKQSCWKAYTSLQVNQRTQIPGHHQRQWLRRLWRDRSKTKCRQLLLCGVLAFGSGRRERVNYFHQSRCWRNSLRIQSQVSSQTANCNQRHQVTFGSFRFYQAWSLEPHKQKSSS